MSITTIANVGPVNAGLDVFYCGLTPTLNAITPVVGTGTWIPVGSGPNVASPNNPTTSATFTSAGTYTYVWFVGYLACPNLSDTLQVTLYDMPTPSSVSGDQTLCISNANSTITANTPSIGTGSWSVVAGPGIATSPSSTISPVTGLSVGVNSFAWVISNGTCPPSSATVNILVDDVPSTPVAGPDQTICINSTTSLNATNPAIGNGVWSVLAGGGSVNTPTFNNSAVSSLVVGVNTFEWVLTNGVCPSVSDTTHIFVDALPSNALAGADQFTCALSTFMAGNIPAIGNGTWVPLGGSPSVNSPTSFSSAVSFTNQGVYSYVWVVGNGTCPTATDVVTINTFLNPSDPDAGPDQTICAMNTTLNANAITVGSGSWIPVNALSSVTNSLANTTGATLPNQGVFGFVWQTSNSAYCPNKNDTVYIRTYTNPSLANAGLDITSSCLLNPLLAITPSVGVGTWSIITGSGTFDDVNSPNTNYISDVDGYVKLVWTVTNGNCPPTHDTLDVFIDPLLIPQIITPNGDGSNDLFEIKLIGCLSGVKMSIFNRWGNLVYDSNDYKNDWKGLNNSGEPLADDTYFYILELPKKTYKGYVVVKTN
jgi:gliding motility-associated-like protein